MGKRKSSSLLAFICLPKRLLLYGGIAALAYISGLLPVATPVGRITPERVLATKRYRMAKPPLAAHILLPSQVIATIGATKEIMTPTPTLLSTPASSNTSPNSASGQVWGVATQVDQDTWTMQVGQDAVMGTPQDVLAALNTYRQKHGSGVLVWDQTLGDYAQTRAVFFANQGKLDAHAGFTDFLNNQDGFKKLGYNSLGENSSIGYTLTGVHLIEWVYAGDKPHNDNQLSNKWSAVGIGITDSATDLVFGGSKQ